MPSDAYEGVLPRAMATVRAASALAAKDVKFHASIDHDLAKDFESFGRRLLSLANKLLGQRISPEESPETMLALEFGETAATSDGQWKKVSDLLDVFFEKADWTMDEVKAPKNASDFLSLSDSMDPGVNTTVLEKPQIHFKVAIDNTEVHPFVPKLTAKPHATKPLDQCLSLYDDGSAPAHYEQPYHEEIMNLPYPESILRKAEPQPSTDWNQTSAIWVGSIDSLNEMTSELRKASEIAVDLEHHDLRSYYGITCLMQISTRAQDWIVDTLALRDDLSTLNSVFADPNVIKVFHGASMDIVWLQRDLGLYVVSLFDTYFASKALGFPKFSLAYLLETFAKFKTSKKYQLADWRIRPLPSVMMDYARADTHFLLNIFDQLRSKLIGADSAKLTEVLENSRKVASKRFEYVRFRPLTSFSSGMFNNDSISADSFITLYNIPFSKQDLVKSIFQWRDRLARDLDESPRYVMANRALLNICSLNEPISPQQVSSCFTNFSKILRENIDLLTAIIQDSFNAMEKDEKKSLELMPIFKTLKVNSELVGEIAELFSLIVEKKKELCKDEDEKLIKKESRIFLGVLLQAGFSVRVPDDGSNPRLVKSTELKKRLESLGKIMFTPMRQTQANFQEPEQDPDVGTDVNAEGALEMSVEKPEIQDEIITLLPRNVTQPEKKQNPVPDEPKVDYLAVEIKVLEKPDTKIRKKKRSYEQFNLQNSDGPQPFKGRKVATHGKTTSFIKKR